MTIKEITNQLYDLSVGGYFNREKFTKASPMPTESPGAA